MVAEDFLQDPPIRGWLDGVEPAWTLLTFESLGALRREPDPPLGPRSGSLSHQGLAASALFLDSRFPRLNGGFYPNFYPGPAPVFSRVEASAYSRC